jgi:hypothetical protein
MKIRIEIDNISEPIAIALEDMFATMQMLGKIGGSRWVCFMSDGDGDCRPKIKVNGKDPKFTTLIDRDRVWSTGEYRIDYDEIAWNLHKD